MDKNPYIYNINTSNIEFINADKLNYKDNEVYFNYLYNTHKEKLSTKQIITFFDFSQDPINNFAGISRIEALRREIGIIDLSNQASENLVKLTGSILISQKPVKGGGDEMYQPTNIMTETNQKSDSRLLEEKLHTKGLGQKRQIFVSQFPLEVQAITKDIVGLEFNKGKDFSGKLIYALYNIPQGYLEQSKFNNRDADKLELYESIVIPIADNFTNSINESYKYKNKIKLSFNHLSFFQEKKRLSDEKLYNQRMLLIEEVEKLKELGYMSENEAKLKLKQNGII